MSKINVVFFIPGNFNINGSILSELNNLIKAFYSRGKTPDLDDIIEIPYDQFIITFALDDLEWDSIKDEFTLTVFIKSICLSENVVVSKLRGIDMTNFPTIMEYL